MAGISTGKDGDSCGNSGGGPTCMALLPTSMASSAQRPLSTWEHKTGQGRQGGMRAAPATKHLRSLGQDGAMFTRGRGSLP